MHRRVKNQILDILDTLAQGVQYVEQSGTQALPVLADCKQTLAAVGQLLWGEQTAPQLEAAGKAVDAALTRLEIKVRNQDDAAQTDTHAAAAVDGLRAALLRHIQTQYQVVFMPYTLSMWDSMQSVWRAAQEDPCCDVYVVPIPYCDRNPDGSAGRIRYEGDQFPSYVPTLHYSKIDLNTLLPDVIYIHNIYDNGNLVTSIAPAYYTEQLKKYTDMLVYIPYYVAGIGVSEHFYMLPGIANVDRVIVESRADQTRFEKYWPSYKFLALGSPKIEKIATLDQYPPEIPAAWREKIKNKTVIFYNTSIGTALLYGEGYIEKLQSTLEFFAKKDDAILLWRPHPLLKSTLQSMRPELLAQYNRLEAQFIQDGRGIYDQTAEYTAAFAVSDAYWGDPSSLLDLYAITGKPILLQDTRVTRHQPRGVAPNGITGDATAMYMTSSLHNGFLRGQMGQEDVEWIGRIPGEKGTDLYSVLLQHQNMVVCVPYKAAQIAVYHIDDASFVKYPIPAPNVSYSPRHQFLAGVSFENNVFLIGYRYPGIVRLNTQTGAVTLHDAWIWTDPLLSDNVRNNASYTVFYRSYSVVGEMLYLPLAFSHSLLAFNMRTGHGTLHRFDQNSGGYGNICYDGKQLWLFENRGGTHLRYNPKTGRSQEYRFPPDVQPTIYGGVYCAHCWFHNGMIWWFPHRCDGTHIRIDPATGDAHRVEIRRDAPLSSCYGNFTAYADGLAATTCSNELLRIRVEGKQLVIDTTRPCLPEAHCSGLAEQAYADWRVQAERVGAIELFTGNEQPAIFTLDTLIRILPALDAHRSTQAACCRAAYINPDNTCGVRIHRAILNELEPENPEASNRQEQETGRMQ